MNGKKFQSSTIVLPTTSISTVETISWLAKTETLQDSLETYQAKLKAKKRNPGGPL